MRALNGKEHQIISAGKWSVLICLEKSYAFTCEVNNSTNSAGQAGWRCVSKPTPLNHSTDPSPYQKIR